jgi:hypothetical protein
MVSPCPRPSPLGLDVVISSVGPQLGSTLSTHMLQVASRRLVFAPPPAGHQPIIFVVSAPPPAPSPLTPRSLFSFLSPSIPWPCSDSPLTNRFACCLRRRHVASSIADLLMFPDDVTMDHMLPCHGSAHHPSLEDRLRGVGFGAW